MRDKFHFFLIINGNWIATGESIIEKTIFNKALSTRNRLKCLLELINCPVSSILNLSTFIKTITSMHRDKKIGRVTEAKTIFIIKDKIKNSLLDHHAYPNQSYNLFMDVSSTGISAILKEQSRLVAIYSEKL